MGSLRYYFFNLFKIDIIYQIKTLRLGDDLRTQRCVHATILGVAQKINNTYIIKNKHNA